MDERRFSHEEARKAPEASLQTGEIPEFSRLRFENLSWREGSTEGDVPVYRAEAAVAVGGKRLFLEASNRIYTQREGNLSSLLFRIRATKESPAGINLFVNISDKEREPQLKVSMNIAREDGSENLPPGMGISVYEKGLDFLSQVAVNKPLLHRELAAPDDGDIENGTHVLPRFSKAVAMNKKTQRPGKKSIPPNQRLLHKYKTLYA
jgi:hypothetical protein